MSEDIESPRDDSSATAPTPRVEIEPTPVAPQGAQETSQLPPAGAAGPDVTAANPVTAGGAGSRYQAATETVAHTVVKTKTKKLPVFVSSLAGLVVGAVLVVALIMTGALDVNRNSGSVTTTTSGSSSSKQTITIDAEDTTLAETVSAKALPSVVSITAITSSDSSNSIFQSDDSSSDSSSGSIGSGVVLDTDGNILTNNHVVTGATSITVSMNGESYEAELVGADTSSDLAVIKLKDVSADDLTPIEVGDSDSLNVGEWVMAIGSPFGNEQSVSTGIVSSLYRSTALPSTDGTYIYANMIQTDAAINPGNSGGALVNDNGELIGINSIIESYSGSSSGVGFAIPSNYAVKIAKQIIAGKTPEHAYLGVRLGTVTASNARQNNLSVNEGAYVGEVISGSPAETAGLEKGDVITKVGDTEVASADSVIIALRSYDVGDKVTLTVQRGSDSKEIEVTLGSDADAQTTEDESSSNNTDSSDGNGSGMTQEEFLEYLRSLLGQQSQGQGQQGQGGM